MTIRYYTACMVGVISQLLGSDLIVEKRASLLHQEKGRRHERIFLSEELSSVKIALKALHEQAESLLENNAPQEEFQKVLREVHLLKKAKLKLETEWHESAREEGLQNSDPDALWDQEEIFISELLREYGSPDYLYAVPHELSGMKLHLHSNISLPRKSWPEFLEILLRHHGLGLKTLNPFAKQLYLLKQDIGSIHTVGDSLAHVHASPDGSRLCYLVTPPLEQLRSVMQFFEKFCDGRQTFIHPIGNKIALIAAKEEVLRLLSLYDKAWGSQLGKVTRMIPANKLPVKEMEKILRSFFYEGARSSKLTLERGDQEPLSFFPLEGGSHLVCIGSKEHVDKAEKIIHMTEHQLSDPAEMVVFLYPCRHSDPHDLAHMLEKVYLSLTLGAKDASSEEMELSFSASSSPHPKEGNAPSLVVAPTPLQPPHQKKIEFEKMGTPHFTPDPKTGSVLMTVRKDILDKLKEVLKKLDIPKKMVQIEVLMFERRLHAQNNYGLNLLKLGKERNGVSYIPSVSPYSPKGQAAGILQFFFHGKEHRHTPQFDVAYNFLLTQDDIHLNASPSVITVNQTPATISIVEEISINNGVAPLDTNQGISFEKSFSRANYGIIIKFTPTVHTPDEKGLPPSVTLKTDITFDTTKPHPDDRPLVDRRHIENEVRILDGETVIIGGLKRKSKMDHEEKVPFFGDIPLLGKLFGTTQLLENDTEMFFFITPKILQTPQEENALGVQEELTRRPGDLPEFLEQVDQAFDVQKRAFFKHSLKSLMSNDR
ncbi:type II secretion system protein GspD [Rhabdochlamydiaceae symbiont of Dictyostelium giganteum]|uniref:type II secretion system protein GspD n=1 Tax=Rhabdochlamydiaceae symbiont of Dictyostelium giganteum TaxID=3342349 RepID=UPI00384C5383